jgi:hypothetical protein
VIIVGMRGWLCVIIMVRASKFELSSNVVSVCVPEIIELASDVLSPDKFEASRAN